MNKIDLFVKNWANKHAMVPINQHDIDELESRLNAFLPESYKYLISKYGLVHSPNVLTKICDLGVDIADVQDFLSLDDVSALSKLYELSGMPTGHILFASDCKGNMFCFKQSDCTRQQTDVPVWLFEHDLSANQGKMNKVANAFTEWLDQFNTL